MREPTLLRGQYTPVTAADAARFRDAGWWPDRTLRSLLTDAATAHPERVALVGHRQGRPPVRLTYRQFDAAANRAASALAAIGIGRGDVVALMLPNWVEYAQLVFGIAELGAVYTGMPVAYGERQAEAIVRRSKARALLVPARWRGGTAHRELAARLRERIPTLEHVVLVGDDHPGPPTPGEHAWAEFLDVPPREFPPPAATDLCYLGFTSGTTGEPKGAMHTHDTLVHPVVALAEHLGPTTFGDPMVQLVASPTGHHSGFVWGILFTAHLHGTGVHVERWERDWGIDVVRAERTTAFFGAPTFVQDMLRTDLAGDPHCPFECLVVAGSSVPRGLPAAAGAAFGAYVAPAWGMTECSIMTSATPAEPDDVQSTDGSVLAGSQVRVVDDEGRDVAPGETGELLMRGPGVALGYFDRPDATGEALLPGLWFRTGDTASLDEHGRLSLRGRSKDLVIRGGENIPVTDVESLLYEHPDVIDAAIVGYPDDRLGERACAVVVARPGSAPDLAGLNGFLLDRGLTRHYLPERLVLLDQLPTTQSGKIQKFKLRDVVAGRSL